MKSNNFQQKENNNLLIKSKSKIDKNKILLYLLFSFLLILIFAFHTKIKYNLDDIYFSEQLNKYSFLGFLKLRYTKWSSRLLIESILIVITKRNIFIWKILDTLILLLTFITILNLTNIKNDKRMVLIAALLFLTYPFLDLSSAGWVATTLNYSWPFAFGMLSFMPLVNYERGKETKKLFYLFAIIGLFYAVNQEQMCALIFGFNLVYLIYKICNKEKISKYNIICLVISIMSLIFIYTCPGNKMRFIIETAKWFPEFSKYTIWEKLYIGLISMFNILISNKIIIAIFVSIVALSSFIYSKKMFDKILSIFTIIITLSITIFSTTTLSIFPKLNSLYTILAYQKFPSISMIYALALSFIVIAFIFVICYLLIITFGKKKNLPLLIFIAAICSRLIMGFSPTIYASGERTAYYLYMSLIIISIFILSKLYKENKINSTTDCFIISILSVFMIYNYINIILSI